MTQFIKLNSEGVHFLNERPKKKFSFHDKKTKVGVCKNLCLEIHGEDFLAQHQLTPDECLGLIAVLSCHLGGFLQLNPTAL